MKKTLAVRGGETVRVFDRENSCYREKAQG